MNKLQCKLHGLDCAHCAAKIQENICKLEGVVSADLVFTTQDLSVELEDESQKARYMEAIARIVKDLEPDVKLMQIGEAREMENSESSSSTRRQLLLLAAGILFFVPGLLLPLPFWPKLGFFLLSYLIAGGDVLWQAFRNCIRGNVFDENFLMSVATIGAFSIQEFPEASAVMLFYKVGQLLEGIAVNQSRRSITSLLDIKPQFANLKTAEGFRQVDPNDVSIGDILLVKPGEKVPLDSVVLEGNSFMDTSALTGESVPRPANPGDTILSGSINTSGSLTVQVQKAFQDSTVSRILDLVQNAASQKAPTESFITKFARYYTPAVVFAALLLAVIPTLVLPGHDFSLWLNRALAFLVVSCPCALVISIPLSYFGGIGSASRKGILVKGGNYLEALNQIDTLVFDKTGTLTKGVFRVSEMVPAEGVSKEELLSHAALAEVHSNHPIAKSILEAFGMVPEGADALQAEEIPGHGIRARQGEKEILAGNDRILHLDSPIPHDTCHVQGTVVHVAVNRKYLGYLLISDQVKEDSAATISELKQKGIRVVMLTGDSEQTAKSVSNSLGIDECYFELLPHEKAEKLQQLKLRNIKSKIAFVGDGINDAPVLAMSDVGIAMGGLGSDAAIEASDIVLMTDEPSKLLEGMNVARRTKHIVWQNILFALGVKLLVMVFVAGGAANMWEAVFADVGVTVIAVFNTLRVLRR